MTSDLVVRPAGEDDLDILVELWLELMRLHAERDMSFPAMAADASERFRDFMAVQIASPDGLVLLAERRNQPHGFANAQHQTLPPVFAERNVGCLDHVYVQPDARRSGIASALVQRCLAWGAERSLTRWTAHVYAWNEPALALLARFGLRPSSLRLMGVSAR